MTDTQDPKDQDKDRTTQQFDKLKDHNAQLKAENEELKKKNLIDSVTPDPNTPKAPAVPSAKTYDNLDQGDVDKIFQDMIDKEGYVDGDKLKQALRDANNKSAAAAEENQKLKSEVEETKKEVREVKRTQEQFEESKIVQAVHAEFPMLDPNGEEFDETFYELVRNDMIGQMAEGKQDIMSAAKKWYNAYYQGEDMKKKDKEIVDKAKAAKKDINATVPRGSSQLRGHWDDQKESNLLKAAQYGKKGAVAELLRRREQGK